MGSRIALLDDRAVLSVSGDDRHAFLQGLLTADVLALAPGQAAPAALLTPQGKILFLFLVVETAGRTLIDCSATQADDLVKRLSMYKLRSKVTIVREADLAVAMVLDGDAPVPEGGVAFVDPRWSGLGVRLIAPRAALAAIATAKASDARSLRLAAGVAEADEIGSGNLFPHEANLDQNAGVSFTKGCYVGQEVVSRMEHRGTARSRLVRVNGASLAPGAAITAGERSIGEVVAVEGENGIALLRLDRLSAAKAAGTDPAVDGKPVAVRAPEGTRFPLDAPAGDA
ncbi:MAG: folate-binding protein [Hyphomicrobiales bacterium]